MRTTPSNDWVWLISSRKVIDRGTDTRSGDAIAEALDGRGVTLNSSVGRHLLTLGCTCLAEDFEDMLALVADVVRRPTFPEAEVETRAAARS